MSNRWLIINENPQHSSEGNDTEIHKNTLQFVLKGQIKYPIVLQELILPKTRVLSLHLHDRKGELMYDILYITIDIV